MTYWALLLLAITLEVCGTTCLKMSQGFARLVPSVLLFLFYGLCFLVLAYVMRKIDLGVAYAIWSGLGIVLTTAVGYLYLGETVSVTRLACVALILIGVVGLDLTTP
jgi:small multidrug resistance pump